MTEQINTALVVLGVGMVTVFIILGLVVLSGQLLIKIVNTFFPPNAIKSPLTDTALINNQSKVVSPSGQSKSTLAAIVAAVDLITQGKGKASKIEKIDRGQR